MSEVSFLPTLSVCSNSSEVVDSFKMLMRSKLSAIEAVLRLIGGQYLETGRTLYHDGLPNLLRYYLKAIARLRGVVRRSETISDRSRGLQSGDI